MEHFGSFDTRFVEKSIRFLSFRIIHKKETVKLKGKEKIIPPLSLLFKKKFVTLHPNRVMFNIKPL